PPRPGLCGTIQPKETDCKVRPQSAMCHQRRQQRRQRKAKRGFLPIGQSRDDWQRVQTSNSRHRLAEVRPWKLVFIMKCQFTDSSERMERLLCEGSTVIACGELDQVGRSVVV